LATPTDELYHVTHLPVLGLMTTFATNSDKVIDAVLALYGSWATLDKTLVSPSSAVVKLLVRDHNLAPPVGPLRYGVPDPAHMTVESSEAAGVADTIKLESVAVVNQGMVARAAEFGEGVVEPLTVFLLAALDRVPLHAAAIMRDGVAILLAGPSGMGKSTLAYAACRNGYTLLADEPVYVQTHPVLRVWGRRPRLHLRGDARTWFPELGDLNPRPLLSGKNKIVIDLHDHGRAAEHMGICLLSRATDGAPSLERLTAQDVIAELATSLDEGYHLFADALPDRLARIAERGAWRLRVGNSPGGAVSLLDDVVRALAR
jgi:hypothetical protein